MKKLNCYRIRRHRGTKDGRHQYHHADIEASHWKTALKLAKILPENEWE